MTGRAQAPRAPAGLLMSFVGAGGAAAGDWRPQQEEPNGWQQLRAECSERPHETLTALRAEFPYHDAPDEPAVRHFVDRDLWLSDRQNAYRMCWVAADVERMLWFARLCRWEAMNPGARQPEECEQ